MVASSLILLCLGASLLPSGAGAFALIQGRGYVTPRGRLHPSPRSLQHKGYSALDRRRAVAMQVNPREDSDFEMTVDWDEELRKLNASQYAKKRADRAKAEADTDVVKWAKTSARKAQSAAQETSYQVRGAMQKNSRWQQLSRDYRFWLGLVAGISLLTSILSATSRSQDLVVWNHVLGVGADGVSDALAHTALAAATTAHAAGDAATQLAETGATMVFA